MTSTLLGSGSKLHRSLECPASVLLPQTRERSESSEKAAYRGRAIHRFKQLLGLGSTKEEAMKQVAEEYPKMNLQTTLKRINPADLALAPGAQYEVALVYHADTQTASVLPAAEDRNYGELKSTDVPLTCDTVVAGHALFEVWDLKTGRSPVPAPKMNPQLLHGALCVTRAMSSASQLGLVGLKTLKGYGKVETSSGIIDSFDIESHEARVLRATELAKKVKAAIDAGEDPPVFPDPERCLWCDAKPSCKGAA